MKKAIVLSVGLALVMALVAPAGAGTIWSADFGSGYTSGSLPTLAQATKTLIWAPDFYGWVLPQTSNSVVGQPNAGPKWSLGDVNPAYVVANPATGGSGNALAILGNYSANQVDPMYTAQDTTLFIPSTSVSVTAPMPAEPTLVFSVKAYYPSAANAGSAPSTLLNVGGRWGNFLNFGTMGYFSNGQNGNPNWCLDQWGSAMAISQDVTPDTWSTATVTVHLNQGDPTTSTVDFSVDGTSVETGAVFDATCFTGGQFAFNVVQDDQIWASNTDLLSGGLGSTMYLADLQVSSPEYTATPEPATMALLALGGLGVLLRRRK